MLKDNNSLAGTGFQHFQGLFKYTLTDQPNDSLSALTTTMVSNKCQIIGEKANGRFHDIIDYHIATILTVKNTANFSFKQL